MGRKRMPGLVERGGIWHIDKQIKGYGRLCESLRTGELEQAETVAAKRITEIIREVTLGIRPKIIFRIAATKYLNEGKHKSLDRDACCLKNWDPLIGDDFIDEICMDSLEAGIEERRAAGVRSGTVVRELAVIRRVLVLAARKWRHKNKRPWLDTVPLIEMPDWKDRKQEYPLSWEEQARFFPLLPDHLAEMALFDVNTGAREEEICALEWDWERPVPELKTSVFIVPSSVRKGNRSDLVLVLNRTARSVIEARRRIHDRYVFTYQGNRLRDGMHHASWINAWRKAGLPTSDDVLKGPHNLRHTFGRRLRASGVPFETRKVLLGHVNGDITTHYSAAELRELINAVEKIATSSRKSPAATILRASVMNGK